MTRNQLVRIDVLELFGEYNHTVFLNNGQPITILSGPNGVGKTHILSMTNEATNGQYQELRSRHFATFILAFSDGTKLTFRRRDDTSTDSPDGVDLIVKMEGAHSLPETILPFDYLDGLSDRIPPWFERVGPEAWYDTRSDRHLSLGEVRSYVRQRGLRPRQATLFEETEGEPLELAIFRKSISIEFVETKRLDSKVIASAGSTARLRHASPIEFYTHAAAEEIGRAKVRSLTAGQQSDKSFPRRLLAGSKANVNETGLRARYQSVRDRVADLVHVSLYDEIFDFALPARLTPTEKRVLNLFLDDVETKIEPLGPLFERLQLLRELINRKFLRKTIQFDSDGISFQSEAGSTITATQLSSGEQHELSLLAYLLFRAPSGGLVMIDEPELSLHVAWQHDMLSDLQRVCAVVGLRFLLATHSTAIINDRWDLVQDLALG